jgi:L-iditol 2-dehydrogenase
LVRALVLIEYGRLELGDVPEPVPGPDDVLVRVAVCGICGSDVHGLDGSTGRRIPPIIMGHEAAGTVAAVGGNVADPAVGRRVTFDSMISCGRCRPCRGGRPNLCDHRRVLGVSCDEFRCEGAFAESVVVPRHIVHCLPEAVSFEQAAFCEPLSVAVHAVGRLPIRLGDAAVVVGAGMIGLLVVQVLRAAGCGLVVAIDLDPARLALAARLGADETLRAGEGDDPAEVAAEVRRRTGGGADVAVEAVGIPQTVAAAIGCVRKGGSVAMVGNLRGDAALPLQAVVTGELSLLGCCASSGEYPACLDMIARRMVHVEPLLSAVAPLEEGPAWFDRLRRGEPGLMKVLLRP